ncbi:unnamed protein product [Rotaria sp. Silwood1]|nr:unnamed protein product [Rotaria sp. Silwood1]CAF1228281.1 unnamed protein product [Rotaria sp. Silwood1]CAF3522499.1 unnamed protein product [Rotaria sp. Silwood1]CAF4881095.1 unnamed protein product [Rotaria sp. Silwood1]
MSNMHSSKGFSRAVLCCMRIIFIPMMIILILIVLVTGVLYGVDLLAQGACRTGHDDQSFLVSFLIDKLLGNSSNEFIIGELDVQSVFTNVIDDCRNRTHFSEYFFKNHLTHLENYTYDAMNQLNEEIFYKFNASIDSIDIRSDIGRLDNLSDKVTSTQVKEKIQPIKNDWTNIQTQFEKISSSIPTLSTGVVNQTIDDVSFRKFL